MAVSTSRLLLLLKNLPFGNKKVSTSDSTLLPVSIPWIVKCGETLKKQTLFQGVDSIQKFLANFLDFLFATTKAIHDKNKPEGIA
jgi:hypothetical protein